jgi:hypothetical protein
MPGKCSICTHKNVAQRKSLADSGESIKAIAEQFQVSRFSLSRHINHHRNPAAPVAGSAGTDDLQSRSDLLWKRSNQIWELASADADLRSAISSVQTGLRSLELQAKQKERDQEIAAEENDDDRVSIGDLDSVIQLFDAVPPDPVNQVKLKIALDKARAANRMDGVAIFFKMLEDSAFAADLTDFATTWKQKEKVDEPVQAQTSASN